jgi:hypothetical protein
MRSRRLTILIVARLALGVASGCSDDPQPPPIVWEGEHLRFGTDGDEATICAGTLPYLDGAVGYLGDVFDRPDARVDYFWMPDGTEPHCVEHADGCAYEGRVFSRHAPHQHELVHAIRWPENLYLPIEEGLAEAFGDDWDRFRVQGDIRDLLEDPAGNGYIPGPGYGLAAHFVSYLHAEYGLDSLTELDASTSYDQSFSGAATAFEQVYDQPLDQVIETYENEYPRCGTLALRDKGYDCGRNVIEAPTEIGAKVRTTISLSCDDPAVLGPRLGQRWTTRTLDVKVAGRYRISGRPLEDQPFEFVEINRCDLSCFDYADDPLSGLAGNQFNSGYCLEPSRYLFRFAVEEDVENDFELNVERTDYPPCE